MNTHLHHTSRITCLTNTLRAIMLYRRLADQTNNHHRRPEKIALLKFLLDLLQDDLLPVHV